METNQSHETKHKICIVGASGKLGKYMIQHALERGYEVVGVCRAESVHKLDAFKDRIRIFPGDTDDREVIARAVAGCDGVLTVLVPWGMKGYSTGTAQAVLDFAEPGARLIFSCGWHITRDGMDRYTRKLRTFVSVFGAVARLLRIADLNDQVGATRCIFASKARWTVVRVSESSSGAQTNGRTFSPNISADGTRVLFVSEATNLAADDTNDIPDTFLRNPMTGTTTLFSRSFVSGAPQNGAPAYNYITTITRDGTGAFITSQATNMLPEIFAQPSQDAIYYVALP